MNEADLFDYLQDILLDPDLKSRKTRLQAAYSQLNGILARASFAEFVKQSWHVLEPATKLEWNWHHQLICDTLQAMFHAWQDAKTQKGRQAKVRSFENYVRNCVVNTPPGSLKSRVISVCYPVWCWIHEPSMRFICLSVNEDATLRDGRMSRDLVRSDWFQNTFRPSWHLKTDQDAISNYGNSVGGERISKPSGSEVVGLRGDCISQSSRILTELGEITIGDLHKAALEGLPLPRVWSVDENGNKVLNRVLATRRTQSVRTVNVCTKSGNVLTCTDDHKIYNHRNNQYTKAKELAGAQVSVVRGSNKTQSQGYTTKVQGLSLRKPDLRSLPETVSEAGSRVRQTESQESNRWTLLQQDLQGPSNWIRKTGDGQELRGLSERVSPPLYKEEPPNVLGRMPRYSGEVRTISKNTTRQTLSNVRHDDGNKLYQNEILFDGLQESPPLYSDDGESESTFQKLPNVRREPVGETVTVNQRAGYEYLCRVWGYKQLQTSADSTSHRLQSEQQCSGESNNTLRSLSHDTSQIETDTVLSVNETFEATSGRAIDVYDLHVEGIHNFIANSIVCSNCLLVDDPNNPKEAENKSERQKVADLWRTNIYNRVNDSRRSLRIGVQQRVHTEDWSGTVLKEQGLWSPDNQFGWLHMVLPAEFDPARKFVMPDCLKKYAKWPGAITEDPRTVENESIHKDRFTPDFLKAEKERWRHTQNYSGQMQQQPTNAQGALVQRQWWGWFRFAKGIREDILTGDHPRPALSHDGPALAVGQKLYNPGEPDFDWITISVDPASKKTDKGSQHGLLCVAGKGGRRFILDDRTQRGAFHEIVDVLKDMIRTWKPDTILIEPKAAGPDIMDTLKEQMLSGDVPMVAIEEAEPGNSDKESRMSAAVPYIKNGAVYILEGASWVNDFLNEISDFPLGSYDDRVDSLSQVLNFKRESSDSLPSW